MIPNISRGGNMAGIMAYLVFTDDPTSTRTTAPLQHNAHTSPHLVAGDAPLMSWYDTAELSKPESAAIAAYLDQPRRVFGTEITGALYRWDAEQHRRVPYAQGRKDVWHCSLSLSAAEGELSDAKWANIAEDFVDKLGFTATSGHAPCRWVAVRHGMSANGNDHVHIALSLVREDGTKALVANDFKRAQTACRELEVEHHLQPLHTAGLDRAQPGFSKGEAAASRRQGLDEPRLLSVRREVRVAATAATTEAEFVRRLRRQTMMVKPWYAKGAGTEVVTGYAVARRVPAGQEPVYFPAGKLGPDFKLAALRQGWETSLRAGMADQPEAEVEAQIVADRKAAAAEWTAGHRGLKPVQPGIETTQLSPGRWRQLANRIEEIQLSLRSVDPSDRDGWAQAAREAAGVYAALARRHPEVGPWKTAADTLGQAAALRAVPVRPKPTPTPRSGWVVMMMTQAAADPQSVMAEAAMQRQLLALTVAIADLLLAQRETRLAERLARLARTELTQLVTANQPAINPNIDPQLAATLASVQAGQTPPRPGSPVPPNLTTDAGRTADPETIRAHPDRSRDHLQPGRDGGTER